MRAILGLNDVNVSAAFKPINLSLFLWYRFTRRDPINAEFPP